MKKALLLFLIFAVATFSITSQVPARFNRITFRLISPSLPDDSSVFICGNLPQLANWDPGKISMSSEGNHTWSFTVAAETLFPVEYKFTLGSWEREGANANGLSLPNFIIKIRSDTVINNQVLSWTSRSPGVIHGQITGRMDYHKQMKGEGLKERDIVVWLPPDYESSGRKRYPVLYMHDGQNLFDPQTSAFGTDWQVDETCDSLIRNGIIGPLIVVGIYNTGDRMSEYTPGKKGEAYMEFVINTVKPFIDSAYMTMPGRRYTYVGGSSAGGTISFMFVWNHPDIFSKAFCLSPAFKIQNINLVKDVLSYKGKMKKISLYIDNGGKGLEERLQPGIDEMLDALNTKGYRSGKDYFWISDPGAEHNEAAWAKRMPQALNILLRE